MIKRLIFSICKTIQYRKNISKKNIYSIKKLIDLNINTLQQKNIKYLALDFDGVMASHGKNKPYNEVCLWLNGLIKDFPEENIFILSNKPTLERLEFFKKNYSKIRFISNVAKKPYPDGLNKIQNILNCKSEEIALVDDRLLTGCLACIIAKCVPILIIKPYSDINYDKKSETFFKFLRFIEQKIFF